MSQIPENLFPEKGNIDRLYHLYSEDSSRDEETIDFWTRNIKNYCLYHNKLKFRLSDVVNDFTISDVKPNSLNHSFILLKQKQVVLERKSLSYSNSSLLSMISSFILMTFNQEKIEDQIFVSKELLELIKTEILNYAQTVDDNVFIISGYDKITDSSTFYSFLLAFKDSIVNKHKELSNILQLITSSDNISIIIEYLVLSKVAIVSSESEVKSNHSSLCLIKLICNNNKHNSSLIISDMDFSTIQLKQTILKIESKIHELTEKIDDNQQKAVKHLKSNDKAQALCHLKIKQNAMKSKDTLSSALLTLLSTTQVWFSRSHSITVIDYHYRR